ncbi:MAG: hypothetical protein WBC51_05680 [Vicinamibacterales bacterium]
MSFWRRWLGGRGQSERVTDAWRADWVRAVAEPQPDAAALAELRSRLDQLSPETDVEMEREMLDGLEQALALTALIAERGLPLIATGHRVVGTDTCHFTAPASMPDEASQPSGRLLLTSTRAIFVGSGRGVTVPWHALTRPTQADRDLVLIRTDGSTLYRFRCNSYGDALCALIIARQLVRR